MALMDRIAISRALSQEMRLFARYRVSIFLRCRYLWPTVCPKRGKELKAGVYPGFFLFFFQGPILVNFTYNFV